MAVLAALRARAADEPCLRFGDQAISCDCFSDDD